VPEKSTNKPLVRRIEDIEEENWSTDDGLIVRWWTLLSKDRTPSAGLTAGIAEIPIDAVVPERGHSHDQNELYFILDGEGTLHTQTGKKQVVKGDTIFLPGGAEHHITNSGMEILRLLYVFDTDSFNDVKYVSHSS
jgi:mannose-6-phosphate isomerase-like protein (cupin superfamily)